MKTNTEKTEITALPWVRDTGLDSVPFIATKRGRKILVHCDTDARAWHDTDYAVRAANAFPKLVEALEYLLETFKQVESCEGFDLQAHPRKDIHSSIEMIESTLALAREGKE